MGAFHPRFHQSYFPFWICHGIDSCPHANMGATPSLMTPESQLTQAEHFWDF